MNISGVVVYTVPAQSQLVVTHLNEIEGVEVHAEENGKLIVTVEKENIGAMADQVMQFQDMPGIMSVAMVYQHSEDIEALNSDDVLLEEPSTCTANSCNDFILEEAQS